MNEATTYFDPHSNQPLPVPPLDDLRSYVCMGDTDFNSLPPDRQSATETWWFTIDHPGFGGELGVEDTPDIAVRLREVGFTEPDIREAVIRLITPADEITNAPGDELERVFTDSFLRFLRKAAGAK